MMKEKLDEQQAQLQKQLDKYGEEEDAFDKEFEEEEQQYKVEGEGKKPEEEEVEGE